MGISDEYWRNQTATQFDLLTTAKLRAENDQLRAINDDLIDQKLELKHQMVVEDLQSENEKLVAALKLADKGYAAECAFLRGEIAKIRTESEAYREALKWIVLCANDPYLMREHARSALGWAKKEEKSANDEDVGFAGFGS